MSDDPAGDYAEWHAQRAGHKVEKFIIPIYDRNFAEDEPAWRSLWHAMVQAENATAVTEPTIEHHVEAIHIEDQPPEMWVITGRAYRNQ